MILSNTGIVSILLESISIHSSYLFIHSFLKQNQISPVSQLIWQASRQMCGLNIGMNLWLLLISEREKENSVETEKLACDENQS